MDKKKGITTGITYRRRDVDDGNGNNENRMTLEFGFPPRKAESKATKPARRVELHEQTLAAPEPTQQQESEP